MGKFPFFEQAVQTIRFKSVAIIRDLKIDSVGLDLNIQNFIPTNKHSQKIQIWASPKSKSSANETFENEHDLESQGRHTSHGC